MESEQLPRSQGHHYDEQPYNNTGLQNVAEGHVDEPPHEKKSVLGKVKARAMKMKDTLTKHTHGHDQDQSPDEDDDQDEEMVEGSDVHGAPIHNSASVTTPAPPPGVNSGLPKGNLERPSAVKEDRNESKISEPQVRPSGQLLEENSGQTRGSLGRKTDAEEARKVHAPKVTDPIGNVGRGDDFTDPIGNVKRGEGDSIGNVRRGDDFTDPNGNVRRDGDNFSDPIGKVGRGDNLGHSGVGTGEKRGVEGDPHAPKDRVEAFAPSNYETKVDEPTGKVEGAGVSPIIHSFNKMGIHDEPQQKPQPEPKQNLYTGSHDQLSPKPTPTNTPTNPQNPESVPKNMDATKPLDRLTENPSNQASYTQMISSAATSVVDKAAMAKNVVASKLGYGGTEPERPNEMKEGNRDSAKRPKEVREGTEASKPVAGAVPEYARKISSKVTAKLAPVYGKVAGAGSTVKPKVQGGGEGPNKGRSVKEYLVEKLRPGEEDKALSEVISGSLSSKGKGGEGEGEGNRGVHEVLSEKGGEGKREGEGNRGVHEVLSDAVHKRAPENEGEETRPMGKVTESKEVAQRLGTGGDEGGEVGGGAGAGKGVVDRVRGTVSSWLGKGSEPQTSQGTTYVGGNEGISSTTGSGEGAADKHGGGETRPQDSSQ